MTVVPRGPDVGEMAIVAFAAGGALEVAVLGELDALTDLDGVVLADFDGVAERRFTGVGGTENDGVAGSCACGVSGNEPPPEAP